MLARIRKTLLYRSRGLRQKRLLWSAGRRCHDAQDYLLRLPNDTTSVAPFTIACMAGKRSLGDLLFALTSLERASGRHAETFVLSDGSLGEKECALLTHWRSGIRIFPDVETLCRKLGYWAPAELWTLARNIIWGKKLLLLNAVQASRDCLLMDSDVIFFMDPLAPGNDLADAIRAGECRCLEDCWESFDPAVHQAAERKNLHPSKRLNDGLAFMPKGKLDAIDWADLIPVESLRQPHIFTNMSALAAALQNVSHQFFPPAKYVVSAHGAGFPRDEQPPFCDLATPYRQLVCRHFIRPVRYLMWLKAFPLLRHTWDHNDG